MLPAVPCSDEQLLLIKQPARALVGTYSALQPHMHTSKGKNAIAPSLAHTSNHSDSIQQEECEFAACMMKQSGHVSQECAKLCEAITHASTGGDINRQPSEAEGLPNLGAAGLRILTEIIALAHHQAINHRLNLEVG